MTVEVVPIAAGTDDVNEQLNNGNVSGGTNDVILGSQFANTFVGGLRFAPVDVPQGATINSAKLTVVPVGGDDPNVNIYADAVDDSSAWNIGNGTFNVTGRAKTTASVSWVASNLGAAAVDSPDLKAIIQEVVNRPGWVSGNALSLVFEYTGSGQDFGAVSRDASATDCPILTIDYTDPAAGFAHSQSVITS
jgi:hypothetical protein